MYLLHKRLYKKHRRIFLTLRKRFSRRRRITLTPTGDLGVASALGKVKVGRSFPLQAVNVQSAVAQKLLLRVPSKRTVLYRHGVYSKTAERAALQLQQELPITQRTQAL